MPKVSFIVAVYNSMPYLTQCLDSLLAQTVKDIEVICVNDCSPDNSAEVISDYIKRDPRVKLINHTTNKRQGGAWNTGVKAATGEFLCFVDADDWLEKDYANVVVDCDNNKDILVAQYYFRGEVKSTNISPQILSQYDGDISLYILLYGGFFITNFYRRSFLNRIAFCFIENNMFQDFLTFTLYLRTKNIKLFEKAGYHYRIDNVSITRKINQSGFWARLDAAKIEYDAFMAIAVPNYYKEAIDIHIYKLFYRNSLMGAFLKFTHIPWERVNEIRKESELLLPNIKNNIYYKRRFEDVSIVGKIPILLFENFPPLLVSLFHKLYLLLRIVLGK